MLYYLKGSTVEFVLGAAIAAQKKSGPPITDENSDVGGRSRFVDIRHESPGEARTNVGSPMKGRSRFVDIRQEAPGEAVANIGDKPLSQRGVVDGEVLANRNDFANSALSGKSHSGKVAVSADINIPGSGKFITDSSYMLPGSKQDTNKPFKPSSLPNLLNAGASISNVEESLINIGRGADLAPQSASGRNLDGTIPSESSSMPKSGPYVSNVEESDLRIGGKQDTQASGVLATNKQDASMLDKGNTRPYIGNIEESVINVGGQNALDTAVARLKIGKGSSLRAVPENPYIGSVEESLINIGAGGTSEIPSSRRDNIAASPVNSINADGGPFANTNPVVTNVEESFINIGGQQDSTTVSSNMKRFLSPPAIPKTISNKRSGPFVNKIEESSLHIGGYPTSVSVPKKDIYARGKSEISTMSESSSLPIDGAVINNIEESIVKIGSRPSLIETAPATDIFAKIPTFTERGDSLNNSPVVNNVEESSITINSRSTSTGAGKDLIAIGSVVPRDILHSNNSPYVRNIEESAVSIDSNVHGQGNNGNNGISTDGRSLANSNPYVGNIEESTINIGSSHGNGISPTGGTSFVKNIEERTINIGKSIGSSVQDLSALNTAVFSGPVVSTKTEDSITPNTMPVVSNIQESVINIKGVPSAAVQNGISAPADSFGDRQSLDGNSAVSGSGPYVNNAEESTVNIGREASIAKFSSGDISEFIGQKLPTTGGTSRTNGVPRLNNVEESTINIHVGPQDASLSPFSKEKFSKPQTGLDVRVTANAGPYVGNVEESMVNVVSNDAGRTSSSLKTSADVDNQRIGSSSSEMAMKVVAENFGAELQKAGGDGCTEYPYRDDGDSLTFDGIDHNCEL